MTRSVAIVLAIAAGSVAASPPRAAPPAGASPAPIAAPGAPPGDPGDARARALFEKTLGAHTSWRSFRAEFVETAVGRASGPGPEESGTVSFKRPGLWRWQYERPERKSMVIRGSVASIVLEDGDVSTYDLEDGNGPSGVGVLLEGGAAALRTFKVRFQREPVGGEALLRLDPLALSDEYEYVLLKIRERDLTILEVDVVDPGGNRLEFRFRGFSRDVDLADSLFELPKSPDHTP